MQITKYKQVKDTDISAIQPKWDGQMFYVYKWNWEIYDAKAIRKGLFNPVELAQSIKEGFFVRIHGKWRRHQGKSQAFALYA